MTQHTNNLAARYYWQTTLQPFIFHQGQGKAEKHKLWVIVIKLCEYIDFRDLISYVAINIKLQHWVGNLNLAWLVYKVFKV